MEIKLIQLNLRINERESSNFHITNFYINEFLSEVISIT